MLYKGATYRNEISPYGSSSNNFRIGKFTGGYYPREIHGLAGGMKKSIISTNPQTSPPLYQSEQQ